MKKKLPASEIANELAGASAFFRKQEAPVVKAIAQKKLSPSTSRSHNSQKHSPIENESQKVDNESTASQQSSNLASYHASTIENIRKQVKGTGREVGFVRMSPEEKQVLKDLVYSYDRKHIKTSENEISRIAINYILEDHRTRGKESVLDKVLAALNA